MISRAATRAPACTTEFLAQQRAGLGAHAHHAMARQGGTGQQWEGKKHGACSCKSGHPWMGALNHKCSGCPGAQGGRGGECECAGSCGGAGNPSPRELLAIPLDAYVLVDLDLPNIDDVVADVPGDLTGGGEFFIPVQDPPPTRTPGVPACPCHPENVTGCMGGDPSTAPSQPDFRERYLRCQPQLAAYRECLEKYKAYLGDPRFGEYAKAVLERCPPLDYPTPDCGFGTCTLSVYSGMDDQAGGPGKPSGPHKRATDDALLARKRAPYHPVWVAGDDNEPALGVSQDPKMWYRGKLSGLLGTGRQFPGVNFGAVFEYTCTCEPQAELHWFKSSRRPRPRRGQIPLPSGRWSRDPVSGDYRIYLDQATAHTQVGDRCMISLVDSPNRLGVESNSWLIVGVVHWEDGQKCLAAAVLVLNVLSAHPSSGDPTLDPRAWVLPLTGRDLRRALSRTPGVPSGIGLGGQIDLGDFPLPE